MVLTPASGTTLRVQAYAAARAASDMHSAQVAVATGDGPTFSTTIELAGTPVGSGEALLTLAPTDEVSLVTAFELQHSSPNESSSGPEVDAPTCNTSGYSAIIRPEIIADPDDAGPKDGATLAFGIATHGDWSTPQGATIGASRSTSIPTATAPRLRAV